MSNHTNDIVGLQSALFDTLRELQNKDKPMEVDRARAICEVGSVIINAAKTEIDFARVNGSVNSQFFIKPIPPLTPQQIAVSKESDHEFEKPETTKSYETKNGHVTVEGNVTRHKLK